MNDDIKTLIAECAIAEQKYLILKADLPLVKNIAIRLYSKTSTIHDGDLASEARQNLIVIEKELSEAKSTFMNLERIVNEYRKQLSQLSSEAILARAIKDDGPFKSAKMAEIDLRELILHVSFLFGKYSRLDREAKKSEEIVSGFSRSNAGGVAVGSATEKAKVDRRNASEVYQSLLDHQQIINEPSIAELVRNSSLLRDLSVVRGNLAKLTAVADSQLQASSAQVLPVQDETLLRDLSTARDGLANLTLPASTLKICGSQALPYQDSPSQERLSEDDVQSLLSKILSEIKTQIDIDKKSNKNIDIINSLYQHMVSCISNFQVSEDYDDLKYNLIICLDRGISNLNTIDCKIYNTYIYCLNLIKDICNLFINLMPNPNPYPKSQFFKSPWTSKLESIKAKLDVDESIDSDDEEEEEEEENVLALN